MAITVKGPMENLAGVVNSHATPTTEGQPKCEGRCDNYERAKTSAIHRNVSEFKAFVNRLLTPAPKEIYMSPDFVEPTQFNGVWQVWLPGLSIAVNDPSMQASLKSFDKLGNDNGILEPEDFQNVSEGISSRFVASAYLDAARKAGYACNGIRAPFLVDIGKLNKHFISLKPKVEDVFSRLQFECVRGLDELVCEFSTDTEDVCQHLTGLYGKNLKNFTEERDLVKKAFETWLSNSELLLSPFINSCTNSCTKVQLPKDVPGELKQEIASTIEEGAFTLHSITFQKLHPVFGAPIHYCGNYSTYIASFKYGSLVYTDDYGVPKAFSSTTYKDDFFCRPTI